MTARLYRKRPVTIEAWQLTEANAYAVSVWCGGMMRFDRHGGQARTVRGVEIETLEGVMCASIGDYVIRGVQGEFYPCKPDIFAATYEPVVEVDHGFVGEGAASIYDVPLPFGDG